MEKQGFYVGTDAVQLIDASRKKYDAGLGCTSGDRYVTSDPIGLIAGVNTYGYVGGNPLVGVDFEGLDVTVVSRPLNMTGGEAGSHTVTVVESGCITTTLSSHNIDGANILMMNHPSDLNLPQNSDNSVVIATPNGMTEQQFDNAVLQQGAVIANAQTADNSYSALSIGSGANCHNTTTCLIERAGGVIPDTYDPPGLNPGLGESGQCPL